MPSILIHLGAFLGLSYAILDRPQVVSMAKMFGYGLGRSVGMLRNYRQNAEKLMKANPDGQKGVMSTMKDLDVVAREIRMAMWMARPGAMLRMGPMGGMGMAITPPPQQVQSQTGMVPGMAPQFSQQLPGQQMAQMGSPMMVVDPSGAEDMYMHDGGSDLLVSSWRNGTEKTKVVKRN